jgi:formamidopyrimidine-DNA glycosylase
VGRSKALRQRSTDVPELPDVEGFRRSMRPAVGRPIESVEVPDPTMLRNSSPQALGRALKQECFREPTRHGKWLLAPAGEVTTLMHFGMTGLLEWAARDMPRHHHDRLIFVCQGGELRYRNMRKLGGVWLTRGDPHEVTGPLGPDAQRVRRDGFHELLSNRRGGVKAALMDQRLLAGVGNLLADEILWRAGVDPRTPVSSLSRGRRDRVYDALRASISESIPRGRVPHGPKWLTRVRDEPSPGCPRCGTRLRKGTVAGRTACWCPSCQRR